jgi:hypothetical protein
MLSSDRLVATTTRLAGPGTGLDAADVSLIAAAGGDGVLWQHEDFGLAGRGAALRIELPRGLADAAAVTGVTGSLAAIQRGDDVAGVPQLWGICVNRHFHLIPAQVAGCG